MHNYRSILQHENGSKPISKLYHYLQYPPEIHSLDLRTVQKKHKLRILKGNFAFPFGVSCLLRRRWSAGTGAKHPQFMAILVWKICEDMGKLMFFCFIIVSLFLLWYFPDMFRPMAYFWLVLFLDVWPFDLLNIWDTKNVSTNCCPTGSPCSQTSEWRPACGEINL